MSLYDPTQSPYPQAGGGIEALTKAIAEGKAITPELMAQLMPGYQSIMGPDGRPMAPYNYNPQGIGSYADLASYNKLKGFATGTGPGEYYRNASNMIDLGTKANLSSIREDTARGLASGYSNLATQGGLDSGARERLAGNSTLARLNASQNVYRDATMGKAGAAMQEGQMRLGALGQVTGMDVDRMKTNTMIDNQGRLVNTGNAIGDLRGGNAYALDQWGTIGDIYGSAAVAGEMGKPGKKPWYQIDMDAMKTGNFSSIYGRTNPMLDRLNAPMTPWREPEPARWLGNNSPWYGGSNSWNPYG